MRRKTALITGVAGMDGSHLADFLLEKGYHVYGIIRRNATRNLENAAHLENNIDIIEGDVTDMSSMLRVIQSCRPHELYNLAAQSHVHTSFEQPIASINIDTVGLINILEAVKTLGYSTRIFHASTSEMFGSSPAPQGMDTKFEPQSPYAIAKLASHHFVKLYRKSYRMYACSGITFNHETMAGFMPIIFKQNGKIDIKPISEVVTHHTNDIPKINTDIKTYQECHVSKDLYVWDFEGWTKVKFASGYPHKGDKNPKFIVSKNASYMATGSHICIMNDGSEKRTEDLIVGDKVHLAPFPKTPYKSNSVSLNVARLIGFIVGDGHIDHRNKVKITGKNKKTLEYYADIWESLGNGVGVYLGKGGFKNSSESIFQYRLNGNDFLRREDFYTVDGKKRIPKVILNSSKDIKEEFLKGYNDANGLKKNKCIYEFKNFKTNSATLALGLIFILKETTSQNFCINVEESSKFGTKTYYYSINVQSNTKWSISKSNEKKELCEKLLSEGVPIRKITRDSGISRSFVQKINKGYFPPNKHHLEISNNEIKKIIDCSDYDGWFFDLETESGTFSCGIGNTHVHNSERRGPLFVTRKITMGVAKCLADPNFKLRLGNIQAKRDWGYAPDFVRGFHMTIQPENPGDYIFATGETHSVQEFCEKAFGHVGLNWEDHVDFDRFLMRPAEVDELCGDYSKTTETLGWKPEVTFEKLVEIMVDHDCELLGVVSKSAK